MLSQPAPLSRDAMRRCDRRAIDEFGIPGIVLMENAGRGAAGIVRQTLPSGGRRVVIVAGKGNNGGDGFVIARHLLNAGLDVRTLLLAEAGAIEGDAAINLAILLKMKAPVSFLPSASAADLAPLLADADIVVDALLGTGISGDVRGSAREAIEAISTSGKPVAAVDIPSGLDADTGRPLGVAVKATVTATMAAPKIGFSSPGAAAYTGQVVVIDISMPRAILDEAVTRGRPLCE